MAFQSQVNQYPAKGVVGARASNNPTATVDAGEGALVAGNGGSYVGSFLWMLGNNAVYPVYGGAIGVTPTLKPAGFLANEQQGLITQWLGDHTLLVPVGMPVTLYERGDFWAKSTYRDAAINDKVFANIFTGQILAGDAGEVPYDPAGATGTITASFATNVMTVTATSVYIAPGMLVTGTDVPVGTYVMAQLTGSAGSTGTYSLTTYPGTVTSSAAIVVTASEGIGGASTTCSANTGQTTLTISAVAAGTIAVGQGVSGTGIASGTYVSALGTSTGGTGTVTLSKNTTATISSGTVYFSAWVETDWYVKSNGNVGDLIKIGVKN